MLRDWGVGGGKGLVFKVWGVRVQSSDYGFVFRILGCRVWGAGEGVYGVGLRV